MNLLYFISKYNSSSKSHSTKDNYIVFPEAPYFVYVVERWCDKNYNNDGLVVLSKSFGFDYKMDKYGRGE